MLGTLPGPLGSWARLLDPDLAGFSWRSLGKAGQGSWALTWLDSAREAWGRLDKAPGPVWALDGHSGTHRTL